MRKKRPIDVHLRHRTIAEMMIEEFMLAANETVAAHMTKHHYPFIYRVHDVPDEDRMQSLSKIMAQFGTVLKIEGKMRPKVLQMALRKVKGKPEEGMISTLALRSMKQAVYQTENCGPLWPCCQGLHAFYLSHPALSRSVGPSSPQGAADGAETFQEGKGKLER